MVSSTHMFMVRIIIQHKNTGTNWKLLDQQFQKGLTVQDMTNTTLNDVGQAGLSECEVHNINLSHIQS